MEISVYLKDYVEKLKKDKMKPFYNKKNLNFDTYNSLTPNWYYKVLR